MKKIILILLLIIPINIWGIDLHSSKYIIYDNTDDTILLEKDMNKNTSIASLTKIMTAIVIIDSNVDLNKKIKITYNMLKNVPKGAYTINLNIGEVCTYNDLLYAILLPSAADAAVALAIDYSGSINKFVSEMNKKAKELNLNNTYFTNPIGMDNNNNKATLEDILKLLKYALNNDIFRKIYTSKEYMLNKRKIYTSLKMYNEDLKLNLNLSRIIGSKTGYTKKAGMALSQIFNSNNHEIISITIGAPHNNNSYHLRDGLKIINYIDNNYNNQVLQKENMLLKELEVRDSNIDKYNIYSDKEIIKYLSNDYNKDDFKIEYNIPEYITYKSNKKIGNIKYFFKDELLYTQEIIVNEEIKPNFISLIKDNILYIGIGISIIIISIISIICKKRLNKKEKVVLK